MRTFAAAVSMMLLAGGLFAQRPGTFGSGTGFGNIIYPGTGRPPVNPRAPGFGNVVFPGTGATPSTTPFSITNPNFARGLGNTVNGRVPYGAGQRGGRNRGSYVYVPYAYPVVVGGYSGYNGYPGQGDQEAPPMAGYPASQPPVIINQTFQTIQPQTAQPMVQELGGAGDYSGISVYQAPTRSQEEMEAAAAQASQPYYLIAFKDHSIYSAVAYWVDGDTLHYFTAGNTHNQVSMSLVDKELTDRLNRERKVDVRLK